jgi:hypothetical protein
MIRKSFSLPEMKGQAINFDWTGDDLRRRRFFDRYLQSLSNVFVLATLGPVSAILQADQPCAYRKYST